MDEQMIKFIERAKQGGLDDKAIVEAISISANNTTKQQGVRAPNTPTSNSSSTELDNMSQDYLAEESLNLSEELEIWYLISPLVQACLPHRKPKSNEFVRINGRLELSMMAPGKVGLPYGVAPRLLLIYMCTVAKKRNTKDISLGRSMRELLQSLNVPVTSGKNGSVKAYSEQLKRLLATHFTIFENIQNEDSKRSGLNIKHAQFVNEASLWWDDDFTDAQATIELSEQFYNAISDVAVPLDSRAIKTLKSSPMELDIYCWLSYRLKYLRKQTIAPWGALMQQLGSHYKEQKTFKYNFLQALKSVLKVYDKANVYEHSRGLILNPSPAQIKSNS